MSTTVEVSDELAARIAAEAARQGVGPAELAARVLAESFPSRRKLGPEQVIDESLAKELEQFKGKWVAVDQARNQVMVSGDSVIDVHGKAVKQGVPDPLIFQVSSNPERLRF